MSWRDDLLRRFPRLARLPGDTYVVGGAIRDILLGRDPADVDVACNDPRAAAELIGRRIIRLGTADHLSAWRVVDAEHVYDFAELLDHDISLDLARRDFTINAMAVHLGSGEFLDRNGGRADIEGRLVRMVDPSNFDDDPLRCLKAVRMAVTLGFAIENATLDAIRARAPLITGVAAERVTYELSVIFSAGKLRRAIELLRETGLDQPLFGKPLIERFAADDVGFAGAMALLVDKPRDYARRWRWSAAQLRDVQTLRSLLDMKGDTRVALYDAGPAVAAQLPAVLRAVGRVERVVMPDFSIRALLDGETIAALTGVAAGPTLGRVKRALLEAQIRGEVTTREDGERFVMKWGSG